MNIRIFSVEFFNDDTRVLLEINQDGVKLWFDSIKSAAENAKLTYVKMGFLQRKEEGFSVDFKPFHNLQDFAHDFGRCVELSELQQIEFWQEFHREKGERNPVGVPY